MLARIERKSPTLPVGLPTVMEVTGRQAVNPAIPPPELPIPDEGAGRGDREVTGTEPSTTAAGLVRLAKFSTPTQTRATAFYWRLDHPVVVRVTIARPGRQPRRRAALTARARIGLPHLMRAPELLDHGRTLQAAYVVEQLVFGAHPRSVPDKQQLGEEVIDTLFETFGQIDLRAASEKTHPATEERLGRLLRLVPFVEGWPTESDLLSAVARLVDAKRPLPTGWTHGDVVFSNLIRDPHGVVYLIDWENAGVRPVVADLAKVAAAMPGTSGLERVLAREPGSALEAAQGGMMLAEQLTRYYLQELSWWEPKYRRAQQTDRMPTFEAWVRRRMELTAILLAA